MKTDRENAVTIRPAGPLDLEFIRDLSERVFSQYGSYERRLMDWFVSETTVTRLALTDERPVGFAMVKKPGEKGYVERISELLAIAVEPEKWRLGIGNLLMKEVHREAEIMQADTLILCTGMDNKPAQELFKKHGFTPWRVKKGYYEGGQEALMMYRVLSQDVGFGGV